MKIKKEEWTPPADPSIGALVARADDDWGDPTSGRKSLIPWGLGILDTITYGIDFNNGGLVVVQGEEKNGKTRFLLNIINNICQSGRWPHGWRIAVDLAESGMPPTKYRDMLISMVATEILIKWHFRPHARYGMEAGDVPLWDILMEPWPDVTPVLLKAPGLGIEPKFLRYMRRTKLQEQAIQAAKYVVSGWPIDIYGPTKDSGDTRNAEVAQERWKYAIERGAHMICYDHAQQMNIHGVNGDYDKLEVFVPLVANTVVTYPGLVFFAVSQVSMGSVAAGRPTSRGGKKLQEEANDVFFIKYVVDYTDDGDITIQCIVDLVESRTSPSCKIKVDVEPPSGLFVGDAYL